MYSLRDGQFSSSGTNFLCTVCGSGSNANKQAQASNTVGNTYDGNGGSAYCVDCAAGKANTNGLECDSCTAGQSSSSGGSCGDCDIGEFF